MKGPFSSSLCLNKSWVGFWQLIQCEQHRAKSPPSYLWHHHCHLKCPHGVHVGHNDGNPWVGLLRISKCEGTLEIHLLAKREKKCFALCDLCRISRVWSKWKKTTKKVYIPWSQDSLSAEPGVPKTGASLRKPSNGLLSRYKSWTWLLNILECQHKAVDVLPSSPASKAQVLSLNSLSQPRHLLSPACFISALHTHIHVLFLHFYCTGGTIPLLRKSTPLLPANPSPPFLTFHYKFALQWATNH